MAENNNVVMVIIASVAMVAIVGLVGLMTFGGSGSSSSLAPPAFLEADSGDVVGQAMATVCPEGTEMWGWYDYNTGRSGSECMSDQRVKIYEKYGTYMYPQ